MMAYAFRPRRRSSVSHAGWFVILPLLMLGFSALSQAQTSISQNPLTVKITSPAPGATVAGSIAVHANATPRSIRIRGVQFMLDGANLGVLDDVPPYWIVWDSRSVTDGPHTLTAVAVGLTDVNATSSPVAITVTNGPGPDTTPPTVSIVSPGTGSTVSGTVAVSASATDDTGVAGVQFLLDGSPLGDEVTAAPYTVAWDTSLSAVGARTLAARARDAAGNTTTSLGVPVTVTVATAPPPPVRFEESGTTLAPASEWSTIGSAGAGATLSGGLAVFTATAGAGATLTFNGTSVTWLGLPCEICGIARVTLDGVVQATPDTYAPARPATSTVVFSARNLSAGNHTLVVEAEGDQNPASGGAYVLVDAFDVAGGSGGGTTSSQTRFEENSAEVTYGGTWYSMDRADASGGSLVESLDSAGSATLAFDGTGVTFIGYKAPILGILSVTLDDVYQASIDTYALDYEGQAPIFSVTGLPAGPHRLMIRPTGTYNPDSCCAYIVVDAFDVDSGG